MFRGVVFDLDGTLVDCFEIHYKAAKLAFSGKFGIEFPREFLKKHYGKSTRRIVSEFFSERGESVSDDDLSDYVARRRREVLELIRGEGVVLLPGALRLLTELKKKNLKLGVATSNTSEMTEGIIEAAELGEYFDAVVSRADVERGKPEPDFFLAAASKLVVDSKDCVAVEDSVYGVASAKKAGMKVVGVTTGFHKREELSADSDLVVHALSELGFEVLSKLFLSKSN